MRRKGKDENLIKFCVPLNNSHVAERKLVPLKRDFTHDILWKIESHGKQLEMNVNVKSFNPRN